ncbi:MAG: rhomboid family intramembrane serine protease [Brevinematia bacterium]
MEKKLILKFRRKERFKDISLLLYAMNIPFEVKNDNGNRLIIISESRRKEALYQIYCYRKENSTDVRGVEPEVETMDYLSYYSIILVFFCFYIFQMIEINFFGEVSIIKLGALSVKGFRNGEWYRVITALTLHSDFLHILSNAFFGGIFAYFVLKKAGSGIGWLLILISGISGNLLSVFLQDESYVSIGSSTACFGALGILTAEKIVNINKASLILKNSIFLPFASSLAFLGLFGTSAGSDITGHFSGYISGLAIGFIYNLLSKKIKSKEKFFNILSGLAAIFIIIVSWLIAFKNFYMS